MYPPERHLPTSGRRGHSPQRHTAADGDDMYTPERHLPTSGQRGHSPQRHTAADDDDMYPPERHLPTPGQRGHSPPAAHCRRHSHDFHISIDIHRYICMVELGPWSVRLGRARTLVGAHASVELGPWSVRAPWSVRTPWSSSGYWSVRTP